MRYRAASANKAAILALREKYKTVTSIIANPTEAAKHPDINSRSFKEIENSIHELMAPGVTLPNRNTRNKALLRYLSRAKLTTPIDIPKYQNITRDFEEICDLLHERLDTTPEQERTQKIPGKSYHWGSESHKDDVLLTILNEKYPE